MAYAWLPFAIVVLSPVLTLPASRLLMETFAEVEPESLGLPTEPWCWDTIFELTTRTVPWGYARVAPTFAAFLVPGLVNLTPFLWLQSHRKSVRIAAVLAGACGLIRWLIPFGLLLQATLGDYASPTPATMVPRSCNANVMGFDYPNCFERVRGASGGTYLWYQDEGPYCPWVLGGFAWLGTLLTWGVYGAIRVSSVASDNS